MKELSLAQSHRISTYHIQEPEVHHDHRFNKKPQDSDEIWRELRYSRGSDINLLANSLTSRLRKAARQRVVTSSNGTLMTTSASSANATRSAPQSGSEHNKRSSHSSSKKDQQIRPSILKRTSSKESTEGPNGHAYRHHYSPASDSPLSEDGVRLPDVFGGSGGRGAGDELGREAEGGHYNNQLLDRRSPALGGVGGVEKIGGGGGGWAGGSSGPVRLVKKAGIFQPSDKYAPGRQTLHGDDQPFAHALAVDYETVTLVSRPYSGQESVFGSSAGVHGRRDLTSGWSSGKSLNSRKKGLKVSWKDPGGEGPEAEDAGDGADGNNSHHPLRLRSAGTVNSDGGGGGAAFAFVKPKFIPGKSRVPYVGLKWKVPTPKVGSRPSVCSPSSDTASGSSKAASESSGRSSPASAQSFSSSAQNQQAPHPGPASHDGRANGQGHRHPNQWRAMMYPRDVHPVTTAMEREGTSVSKTKWHVPGKRKIPAYTFIEDLMESRCSQWHPALHVRSTRPTTRATVDGQSLAIRLTKDGEEIRRKGGDGGAGGLDAQKMLSDGGTLSSSAYTGCFSDCAYTNEPTYRS